MRRVPCAQVGSCCSWTVEHLLRASLSLTCTSLSLADMIADDMSQCCSRVRCQEQQQPFQRVVRCGVAAATDLPCQTAESPYYVAYCVALLALGAVCSSRQLAGSIADPR